MSPPYHPQTPESTDAAGSHHTDRAVSYVVEYALTTTLTLLVLGTVAGVMITEADSAQRQAVDRELERIGYEVAATAEAVDRQAASSTTTRVEIQAETPQTIRGIDYSVRVRSNNVTVSTTTPGNRQSITVPANISTPVDEARTASGRNVTIVYDDSSNTIRLAT